MLPGRVRFALFTVAACAAGHPVDALRARPTKDEIIAACSGGSDNEVRLVRGVSRDTPVLVLREVRGHGGSAVQPTLAIWNDGRVLFGNQTAEMSEAQVKGVVRDVALELATAPRFANAETGPYIIDGGQLTTITVYDGQRWSSASVYGGFEEDFLSAVSPKPPNPALPPPTSEGEIDTSRYVPAMEPASPPLPFARAYQRALRARPEHGVPALPYDFDIAFMVPEAVYERQGQAELLWPRSLPPPPRARDIEVCQSRDRDVCRFELDVAYRDAALRLRAKLHASKVPPYVAIDGQRFMVRIDEFYQGERSIKALTDCSAYLSRRQQSSR